MRGVTLVICVAYLVGGCAMQTQQPEPKGDAHELVINADKAYAAGNWKVAEQAYRDVIATKPADFYAYFRLGNTLVKQNRLDEAASAYRDALLHDASKTEIYNNLAVVRLTQAENALNASLKTLPDKDGNAAQIRYMLWELKKVSRVNLQTDVTTPVATK
jgi:cytochrome c-type biogenesis protein CcmH/NrfG